MTPPEHKCVNRSSLILFDELCTSVIPYLTLSDILETSTMCKIWRKWCDHRIQGKKIKGWMTSVHLSPKHTSKRMVQLLKHSRLKKLTLSGIALRFFEIFYIIKESSKQQKGRRLETAVLFFKLKTIIRKKSNFSGMTSEVDNIRELSLTNCNIHYACVIFLTRFRRITKLSLGP